MEERTVRERCNIAGFEYGGKSSKPRAAGGLWELEKAKKWILP